MIGDTNSGAKTPNLETKTVNLANETYSANGYTISKTNDNNNYDGLNQVTVVAKLSDEKIVNPTTSQQIIKLDQTTYPNDAQYYGMS